MKEPKNHFEALSKQRRPVSHAEFMRIAHQAASRLPLPKISRKGRKAVKPGDRLEFTAKTLDLPMIDYSRGRLVRQKRQASQSPILACFRGNGRPAIAQARHDARAGKLYVDVPEDARDGIVVMLLPVQERFGTAESMKRIDPKGEILRNEFGIVTGKNPRRAPNMKNDTRLCKSIWLGRGLVTKTKYVAIYTGVLRMICKTCPICCPHGALQFDPVTGECTVDPELCRGQWYTINRSELVDVNGVQVFYRYPDNVCWECFNPTDGAISTRCHQRKLRKVLHLGPYCCGSCNWNSRVAGVKLNYLCPNGAISQSGRFYVDKSKCNGCFSCYDNLNCYNNINTTSHNMNTVRMVTHKGESLLNVVLVLRSVKLRPASPDTMRRFSLLVIADGSESTLSFTLDENWSHVFEGEQIEFGDSLHIAVLSKVSGGSYRFVGFDRTGLNLPIRSIISEDIVVKIDSLPHWERRRMSIPTAIGEFTLEFALHCRLAFWTEWAHLPDDQL